MTPGPLRTYRPSSRPSFDTYGSILAGLSVLTRAILATRPLAEGFTSTKDTTPSIVWFWMVLAT